MRRTYIADDNKRLSVEGFFEVIRDEVDLSDESSIFGAAEPFRQLGNNPEVIFEIVESGLKDLASFQGHNAASAQTFLVGDSHLADCYLRVAVWNPLTLDLRFMEADWYSYGLAHNHNFTLLTQTIVGAGYGTSIYSLPEPFSGSIGETIQLGSPEELVLEPNLVLMYEAGKDIHVQHPVDETTVSLNLLAFRPEMKQHVFDLATSKVTWAKFGEDDRILSLLELACAAATEDCKELVREIALYNPSPSVRLCAFLTLKKYGAIPEGSISELMQRDNSRLVRESTALTIDHLKAGEWTPATVGQR